MSSAVRRSAASGLSSVLSPTEVFIGLDPKLAHAVQIALGVAALTVLGMLVAAIASWFLLPVVTRSRLFVVVDVAVLAAFAYTTWRFPIRPTDAVPALLGPTLRLTATSLFALRASVRALPTFLDVGMVRPLGTRVPVTVDLETRAWEVYLLHTDRQQVERDAARVRRLLRYS